MNEKLVDDTCEKVRAVLSEAKLSARELLNVVIQMTYESGLGVYTYEGGRISEDPIADLRRIVVEQKENPSLGKAMMLQSEALRSYYLTYLHKAVVESTKAS